MPKPHHVIPIIKQSAPTAKPRVHYDCAKCPGYCCSYDLIEVGKRDIARLAASRAFLDTRLRDCVKTYELMSS